MARQDGKFKKITKNPYWHHARPDGQGRAIALIALFAAAAIGLSCVFSGVSVSAASKGTEKPAVRLNELMSENKTTAFTDDGEPADWIEIINTSDEAVQLKNWGIVLETSFKKMYSFPNRLLQPGECVTVWCRGGSAAGETEAPFTLSASGGETITLIDSKGAAVDAVVTPELAADQSYARTDSDEWSVSASGTPGSANVIADASGAAVSEANIAVVPSAVQISEIMTSNTIYPIGANSVVADYIELLNTSAESVSLNGWYLSDVVSDLKKWTFPDVEIPAGGTVTVICSGEDRSADVNDLRASFKLGTGETAALTNADGQTVSLVKIPELARNQAYSLQGGVWTTDLAPTPGSVNNARNANSLNVSLNASRNNTGVVINEIMASPTNEKYDWIELYNSGNTAVDLSGWGISDDASKPRKAQLPAGTSIGPQQYLGIFLSGTEAASLNGFLNLPFALSAAGGYTVSLSTDSGTVLEAVYIPQQYGGISYGRSDKGDGFYFLETATPNARNEGNAYLGRAQTAQYSVKGGVFQNGQSFTVELSAPSGSRICYTLDSSDPDENAQVYSGPISVSGTTVLRTRVYSQDYMPSPVETQTYLYGITVPQQAYIVSVVSDEDNLYGESRGILSHPTKEWEREAHVEIYTSSGEQVISQRCGLKVHGAGSRTNSIVGLKIKAGSEYGKRYFEYPIFKERDYDTFNALLLRVGGQDYNKTMMRDSVLEKLAKGTGLEYQESEVCVVYMNGGYYALADIREVVNTHTICNYNGWQGQEDDIDFGVANFAVLQGDCSDYEKMVNWLKTAKGTDREIYDTVASVIDIRNYMEYMAIELFVGNGDTLNVKRFRNKNADGKWRWFLYDLDWGFQTDTNSVTRWENPKGMDQGFRTDNTLWRSMMANSIFFEEFSTLFGRKLATTFSTEAVIPMFRERYAIIETLIPEHMAKVGTSEKKFNKNLQGLFDYAKERPAKIMTYYINQYKLSNDDAERYFGDAKRVMQAYAAKN